MLVLTTATVALRSLPQYLSPAISRPVLLADHSSVCSKPCFTDDVEHSCGRGGGWRCTTVQTPLQDSPWRFRFFRKLSQHLRLGVERWLNGHPWRWCEHRPRLSTGVSRAAAVVVPLGVVVAKHGTQYILVILASAAFQALFAAFKLSRYELDLECGPSASSPIGLLLVASQMSIFTQAPAVLPAVLVAALW